MKSRLPEQLREQMRYLDYSQNIGKVYLYRPRRLQHAARSAENILASVF